MMPSTTHGAYGFRLDSLGHRLLVPVPGNWPGIRVSQERRPAEDAPTPTRIGTDGGSVPLLGGGRIELVRDPPTATLYLDRELSEDEIAHPYLGPIASVHAHWLGRLAFHGGGIVVEGKVWGVLGRREAGKSSFLAEAWRQGVPVVADDLLTVDGTTAFAGPRSLDLRKPAAEHFGSGRMLGVVGQRERWRIELPGVPPHLPMAGWIFLRWGRSRAIEAIGLTDRIVRLPASRSVRIGSADAAPLLSLATLPALSVTMTRRWSSLPSVVRSVRETVEDLERSG